MRGKVSLQEMTNCLRTEKLLLQLSHQMMKIIMMAMPALPTCKYASSSLLLFMMKAGSLLPINFLGGNRELENVSQMLKTYKSTNKA